MKRRNWVRFLAICLAGSMLLAGCNTQAENTETQTTESAEPTSSLQNRVGSKVPAAFQNNGTTVPEEEIKATGFSYDEDNMDYRLVWSDEFDYEGLPDSTKWSYNVGGNGWGNQELQYYTDEGNAYVENGLLTIELRKEEKGN